MIHIGDSVSEKLPPCKCGREGKDGSWRRPLDGVHGGVPDENRPIGLSKEEIIAALGRLNDYLAGAGVIGELCLFGGTAMVLVFNARLSTRDVDAIFMPATLIRELAVKVAEERGLSSTWLNDGVKGFQSDQPEITQESVPQFSHLRIYRPSANYLLAMKCMASRTSGPETAGDRGDILVLINHLGLKTSEEVIQNVTRFFPPERILPKTQFMIHEVIADLKSRN
jgi:hypothetical protein